MRRPLMVARRYSTRTRRCNSATSSWYGAPSSWRYCWKDSRIRASTWSRCSVQLSHFLFTSFSKKGWGAGPGRGWGQTKGAGPDMG